MALTREHEYELRIFIATAEACWRKEAPSQSWHVLDWMSHRLRQKYPLVRRCDTIVVTDADCVT